MFNDEVGTENPQDFQGSDDGANNTDTGAGTETPVVEADMVGRLRGQRDHYRNKSERLQAQLDEGGTQPKEVTPPAPAKPSDTAGIDRLTAVELKTEGYSKEEITEIVNYSKGAGMSVEEATNSSFVKSAIEAMRETARIAAGTPNPSERTASLVVGEKDVKDMTPKEHKENYPALRAKAAANRSGNRGNSSRV